MAQVTLPTSPPQNLNQSSSRLLSPKEFLVTHFKPCQYESPLLVNGTCVHFVSDSDHILLDPSIEHNDDLMGSGTIFSSPTGSAVSSAGTNSVANPLLAPSASSAVNYNEAARVQLAGPRKKIYFCPKTVVAGMVTCGGVCPGLNNVVRALVHVLYHR
jgi:hypothetical protein